MNRILGLGRLAARLTPWPWPARRLAWRTRTACWLYLGLVGLSWLVMWSQGDVSPIPTLLLFGPRWISAAPLVVLVPPAAVVDRQSLVPLGLAGLMAAFPVTGANVPVWQAFEPVSAGTRLRLLTCNTDGPHLNRAALGDLITETMPDIVLLQEFHADGAAEVFWQREWHTRRGPYGLFLASSFPVAEAAYLSDDRLGGRGAVGRYQLTGFGDSGSIFVVNVHLATPREGFEAVLRRHPDWLNILQQDIDIRRHESDTAGRWVADLPGPVLLGGDFNMPSDSAIFREFWSGYQDCFSAAGWGWGPTKFTRFFGVRIDHVLTGPGWYCRHCQVGRDVGSDHRPVIADLVRPAADR